MKLNDEDLESNVPEEPLPERDVLLEALVDVETEAAPRRRISKTLIAACVFSGLGVWQIVHVSKGGEPIFQLAPKAKTAPTKLHSDGRVPIGRVLQSTDPIATYLERAKRGMTDQEIRWMIEDFQTAGLDESLSELQTETFARAHRTRQNAWYLETLGDALNLSSQQKAVARERLDALLERDLKVFMDMVNKPGNSGGVDVDALMDYAHPRRWLKNEGYAPWKLCDLSQEQSRLTLQRWKSEAKKSDLKTTDTEKASSTAEDSPRWIETQKLAIQEPISGNLLEFPEAGETNDTFLFYDDSPFSGIVRISDAFPLTLDQKLADHRQNVMDQLKLLQPAQLRMALLLEPSLPEIFADYLNPRSIQIEENTIAPVDGGILPDSAVDSDLRNTEQLDRMLKNTDDFAIPESKEDDIPKAVSPAAPETPVDPVPEPDPK